MRISAGSMRGRKLLPPPGAPTSVRRDGSTKTRPMTGMVKKSLFGMLDAAGRLDDTVVLDLYAGTGTLGLEAISHGAGRCYFAERDRGALGRLQRNIETCGVGDIATVWAGNIETRLTGWLGEIAEDEKVETVFVDPPYAMARRWSDGGDDWRRAVECIFSPLAEHLSGDGTVVVRTDAGGEIPPLVGILAIRRVRRYGDMVVSLLGHVHKSE